MKLTMAGKIALFANLALSVMFAFWGLAIYSQRINWTNKKLGDRDGKYSKRDAEIKLLSAARGPIEKRWVTALKFPRGVLALEASRAPKQAWYKQQLEILKTGDANQPIRGIEFAQGQIRLDAKGYPLMTVITDQEKKPIPGLASLLILNDAHMRVEREIVRVTGEIKKLVQQEKALTEQLGDGKAQGLRFDLAQQQFAEKRALDEQEYLQPLLYNSMVEQQSLEYRQKFLEDRVKQLQAASVARQR
jgi:hypothetical protein